MSIAKISKALLDMSRFDDEVLHVTDLGRSAFAAAKLEPAQQRLMERVDGFRSMDQLFALSGDIVGVHGVLGKLLVMGYIAPDRNSAQNDPIIAQVRPPLVVEKARTAPAVVSAAAGPSRAATAAKPPPKAAISELDAAKRLLTLEARHLMGAAADRMQPRIEACTSIAEIYDLIVKLQRHLSSKNNAAPNASLDRLIRGLEVARKSSPMPTSAAA
ncbi:MAG: hypothetical protein LH481_15685 [Burkholderiales bacterium]|nr:hypothetical protein [Burkholderiales bacterium]